MISQRNRNESGLLIVQIMRREHSSIPYVLSHTTFDSFNFLRSIPFVQLFGDTGMLIGWRLIGSRLEFSLFTLSISFKFFRVLFGRWASEINDARVLQIIPRQISDWWIKFLARAAFALKWITEEGWSEGLKRRSQKVWVRWRVGVRCRWTSMNFWWTFERRSLELFDEESSWHRSSVVKRSAAIKRSAVS